MKKYNFTVIFDMDGVLVDNDKFHFIAWKEFVKQFNIKLNNSFYQKHINARKAQETIIKISNKKLTPKAIKELIEEKEFAYRKIYKQYIKPTKGLLKFLSTLKKNKIKLVVATSATKDNVDFVLDGIKIRKYFPHIINASHVTKDKPHPEVYLKAAKLINADPKKCIVFEDALNGIESAQKAKMKVVALETTHRSKELGHADLVIKDFSKITLKNLESLIKG